MQHFIKVKFRRFLAVIWHCRDRIDYKIRKHNTRPVLCATVYYRRTIVSRYILLSNWKQLRVFKIAKFEFKVTIYYGLWAKCTLLWPLKYITQAGCLSHTSEIEFITCRPIRLSHYHISCLVTFVSKALWYRTFKKLDCSLIWNFYRMYHSIQSSNCANFMKINGQFFARGQNVLYNTQVLRL